MHLGGHHNYNQLSKEKIALTNDVKFNTIEYRILNLCILTRNY